MARTDPRATTSKTRYSRALTEVSTKRDLGTPSTRSEFILGLAPGSAHSFAPAAYLACRARPAGSAGSNGPYLQHGADDETPVAAGEWPPGRSLIGSSGRFGMRLITEPRITGEPLDGAR